MGVAQGIQPMLVEEFIRPATMLREVVAQEVKTRLPHASQQWLMRDRVEVTHQIGIHHKHIALLQELVRSPQRILATSSRPEAVAVRSEFFDRHMIHSRSTLVGNDLSGRRVQIPLRGRLVVLEVWSGLSSRLTVEPDSSSDSPTGQGSARRHLGFAIS